MRALRRRGAEVEVSTLDVTDAGEAAALVELSGRGRPLGGVFHLAMYLDDRLLANQVQTCPKPRFRALGQGFHLAIPGRPPAGQPGAPGDTQPPAGYRCRCMGTILTDALICQAPRAGQRFVRSHALTTYGNILSSMVAQHVTALPLPR